MNQGIQEWDKGWQHPIFRWLRTHLVKRFELDILWWTSVIEERTFNSIIVVCSYGNQSSLATQIVVKLVLKVNEAVVRFLKRKSTLEYCLDCWRADLS